MITVRCDSASTTCTHAVTALQYKLVNRSTTFTMSTSRRLLSASALFFLALVAVRPLHAQDATAGDLQKDGVTKSPSTEEKPDPLKRPLSDKEKIAQRKALKQELKG